MNYLGNIDRGTLNPKPYIGDMENEMEPEFCMLVHMDYMVFAQGLGALGLGFQGEGFRG